eukprot:m.59271 g.59271  ORF g.59271 m.59271 type:complete len:58 (+) comp13215_c1_seq2:1870-2043(+)
MIEEIFISTSAPLFAAYGHRYVCTLFLSPVFLLLFLFSFSLSPCLHLFFLFQSLMWR